MSRLLFGISSRFFGPAMAVLPAETPKAPLSVFIEIDSTGRDGAGPLTVISRPSFFSSNSPPRGRGQFGKRINQGVRYAP